MSEKLHNSNSLPKWLEDQQHHSYQIEILIAGGALLFLAQIIPDYFKDFLIFSLQKGEYEAEVSILTFGGYIFSRALLIGFAINLILRTLWLAYLGINFTFPKGVNYNQLQYSDYFKSKMEQQPNAVQRIIKLEKICSLTYSFSIIMTLMAIGLFLMLAVLFFFIHYVLPSIYTPDWGFFFLLLFGLTILGVLDFLFFRLFRKSVVVSKRYYPFYKFFGWISLSFLYRKEWLTLISNSRHWKVLLLFFSYFMLAFASTSYELRDLFSNGSGMKTVFAKDWLEERDFIYQSTLLRMKSRNYDDLIGSKERVLNMSLNSRVIEQDWLSLFVVYWRYFDQPLERIFEENEVETRRDSLRSWKLLAQNDEKINQSLRKFFEVRIDGELQDSLDWFYQKHPITKEDGFITFVPLDSLQNGAHEIRLLRQTLRNDTLRMERSVGLVPFVKQKAFGSRQ